MKQEHITAASSTIDALLRLYYSRRYQGVYPDQRQALLWLLSEVGEMVAAWLATRPRLSPLDRVLLLAVIALGHVAEWIVKREKRWIRNGDRKSAANLPHEIGDTQMMLEIFSIRSGNGEAVYNMAAKMRAKVPDLLDEKIIDPAAGSGAYFTPEHISKFVQNPPYGE